MSDVSAEDGGDYACEARLSHAGRQYSVSHRIAVSVGKCGCLPRSACPGPSREE